MKNRLKILFMDFEIPYLLKDINYPVGGSCVRMYAFSKGLIELGHKVGILTWKGANAFVNSKTELELIETYSLDRGIRKLRWIYMNFPKLFFKTISFNPDVLICKSPANTLGIMAIISFLLRIKLVFMITNDIIADNRYIKKQNIINQLLHSFGLLFSQAIFCQNQYQYKLIKKKFPKKIVFKITNPYYNDSDFEISVSSSKRKYVAWLGIFQYQKNLPALLRIARKNPNLTFHIAGSEGSNIDKSSKNAIKKLEECDNVKFVGYIKRNQISPFLSKAYALLNTSHYEGFSNTFLEAFAVGKPVVSLGVNPDNILTKYNLGYVTNENDVGDKINFLITDRRFNELDKRIMEYLKNYHDYKKLSAKLSSKLLSVVSGMR
jgi:glycosyltransferase involved in cell wall biosynthesis